jgi:DNA polymerase-3 subunit epsilon
LPVPGQGFAVIDVETTGLRPNYDRILEVAVVRTDQCGRIEDEWTTLVNPAGPVGATHVHGITAADVRRAPGFVEVLGELNFLLTGRAVVAHNARFDVAFVRGEYERAGWALPPVPVLCTLNTSKTYLPSLARRRLADCCAAAGIEVRDAHSALGDARATAALLAFYLDPGTGRRPAREHLELPARAAMVVWPRVPRSRVNAALRESARINIAAPATHSPATAAPPTPPLSAEDPAAVRAWARERGYDVGTRGRISTNVLIAYRAAHTRSGGLASR